VQERANVEALGADIRALDRRLSESASEIERMRSQIQAIEGGYGVYSTSDYEYKSLISRHNLAVDEHNTTVARRRRAYSTYQDALNAFNQHVDAYNAGLRP
jgi:chromosome segregation ATPase